MCSCEITLTVPHLRLATQIDFRNMTDAVSIAGG